MPFKHKPSIARFPYAQGQSPGGFPSLYEYPTPQTTLELLASWAIGPTLENPHSLKERYKFLCPLPGHGGDTHPSFSVHQDGVQWYCFPCGQGGGPAKLIELLAGGPTARLPKPPKPLKRPTKERAAPLPGCTLAQLAQAKGLPLAHLQNLGWYETTWHYKLNGRRTTCKSVAMPYPGSVQHRVALTQQDRFRWEPGRPASAKELYGLGWLKATNQTILLVEGTTDVAAALLLGIPCVGLPGTGTWSRKNGPAWAKQLADRGIVLWREPGDAAAKLAASVAQDIPGLRVIPAPPAIKDIVELLNQAGAGAADWLRELIAEAKPYLAPTSEPRSERVGVTPTVTRIQAYCNRRSDRRERSALWRSLEEAFPMPEGIKPWTRGAIVFSRKAGKPIAVDFIGNSWRNPANAQHKRRCLMYNLLPRLNSRQLYVLRVAVDDWSEQTHQTLKQRMHRALAKDQAEQSGWVWFDTALKRGCYTYLTNVLDLPGFELVEDVESLLVDCLKSITPLEQAAPGRCRPYGGSKNWTMKAEGTGEEDKDICDVIAISNSPTDFVQLEAECIASGISYWSTQPYWRGQVGQGLELTMGFAEAVRLASDLGYQLTKYGRLGAASWDQGNAEREGRRKVVATTRGSPNPGAWDDDYIEGVL